MYSPTEPEELLIYVDGSVTRDNRGGVGVRILSINSGGEAVTSDFQSAGYANVSSGQMELIACIHALEIVRGRRLDFGKRQITIFTDSKYAADNYRTAMFHWVGNRWLWRDGRPVLDASEWKKLVKLIKDYSNLGVFVEIKWLKGHSTNTHNNAVHKMAKEILRLPSATYSKTSVISVFRPRPISSSRKLELGSVNMEGQQVSIKILSVEYLKQQKLWCYRYAVVSKRSRYVHCVDKIFSTISLDVGKSYLVRFNRDTRNPRIERMYREVYQP